MGNWLKFKETILHVGDTIRVYEKIKELEKGAARTKRGVEEKVKIRLHPFEGVVIAIKNAGVNQSFTVRKMASAGVAVERIWPVFCPSIEKIVVKQKGKKIRRAKLYYLRKK